MGHKFKIRAARLRNKSLHTTLKSRNAIVEAFHTQKVIKQRLSKQMVSSQERRSRVLNRGFGRANKPMF